MKKNPTYKEAIPLIVAHYKTHLAIAKILGYDDLRNISPWMRGDRPFPPEHCVAIEADSGGAIKRADMRPEDFSRFWPDLATQAKAA